MNAIRNSVDIIINDEVLTLLPQKAIYIRSERALLVADIHLGKTGHFRNAGIPVPSDLAFADLETLDDLLNDINLEIERLIVLGDLFHDRLNFDWRIFEEWRIKNSHIKIQLVKGNHDILAHDIYISLDIKVFDLAIVNKIMFVHKFKDEDQFNGMYKICGHIHPAVRIHGRARQGLTLPCFYFGQNFGILPSFGKFTGNYIIRPSENDSVFVIADIEDGKKVIKL